MAAWPGATSMTSVVGTPASIAARLAATLSPSRRIWSGGGPIQVRPAAVTAALAKLESEAPGATSAMLSSVVERLAAPAAERDPGLRTAATRARVLFGGRDGDDESHRRAAVEPTVREPEFVEKNALADFLLARWQRDLRDAASYTPR